MINRIKDLTIVFLKDYYQNLNIINKKKNKMNAKSVFAWLLIILNICLGYISYKIINYLVKAGQPILFLKFYLPIISAIMLFQLTLLACTIFYYSKDLEHILPLPLKPVEILLAKLNTVIVIMYFVEGIFLVLPLFMYGILAVKRILFFLLMLISLAVFPILFTVLMSTIMLFAMKLSKIFKNKDLFQLIITCTITLIISTAAVKNIEYIIQKETPENIETLQVVNMKIDEVNRNLIIVNPIIKILTSNKLFEIILNIIKLIFINLIALLIFIFFGKKLYLKNILQNINYIRVNKINNKKNKYEKNNKIKTYIKTDMKKIIKNPNYFMQDIFQYICIAVFLILIINFLLPIFIDQIKSGEILSSISIEDFKLQATMIVIGIIQILFTFSNLSITAVSREGKNAVFMKYIPISLYDQFKIKALPQIILNVPIIIGILTVIYCKVPEITIGYYSVALILALIMNVINSYIMVLIDFRKPNLNWTNEESIAKDNGNKLYQYVNTIIIFLLFTYFAKIFEGIKYIYSITIIIIILSIIFILFKTYIKRNIGKICNKIY